MEKKNNMNIILAVIICLALAGVLIFISINNKVNMSNDTKTGGLTGGTPYGDGTSPTEPTTNTPGAAIPSPKGAPSGETAKTGLPAKTGDTVAMNYTGRLQNGTVFDSNVDPKFNHVQPFIFKLGAGQVIAGWDKGIVGMRVGEKKTLTISPGDAYGASGIPGTIPPNATLVFDVELLAIKK